MYIFVCMPVCVSVCVSRCVLACALRIRKPPGEDKITERERERAGRRGSRSDIKRKTPTIRHSSDEDFPETPTMAQIKKRKSSIAITTITERGRGGNGPRKGKRSGKQEDGDRAKAPGSNPRGRGRGTRVSGQLTLSGPGERGKLAGMAAAALL